ncbi:MAG: exodeoxyribonuclease VII small subunit [Bacteroidetes bacterium]|nr:exodeoxyribonuclease VII small subunit [Bacteroidota bacterium]
MKKQLTYEEAFNELKMITSDINDETVSVDLLTQKIERASFLINYCTSKLKATEIEMNKIIEQIQD